MTCALFLLSACAEDKAEDKDDPGLTGDAGSSATASSATASDAGLDFKPFDDALQSAIDSYNASDAGTALPIRGASAVVVHKDLGAVHTKGFGQFAPDRLYLIASAGKILTVGALKRLEEQGKLDFAAPISKYLGATWGEHKTSVSLAQLVSNSSGLPSLGEILALATNPTAELLTQYSAHLCQYRPDGSLSDCGKSIYQDDLPANNRTPDQTFRYGGSQWQLAGAVAEAVTGKTWSEVIRETYAACDVPSLGFTNPYGQAGVSPLGYPSFDATQSKLPVTNNPSIEGGGYSTAPDYAKLLLMHLRGGKCGDTSVLSPASVAAMQKDRVMAYGGSPSTGATTGGSTSIFTGYGLGWWVSDQLIADPGAYGAFPFLDLKRGYGAIIMLEVSSSVGAQVGLAAKPKLDAIFDALKK